MKNRLFTFLFLFLLVNPPAHAEPFKIAMFSPKGDSPFWALGAGRWALVANFAREAANDLGVEFRLYDAKMSQYEMKKQVQVAVSGPDKVDAIMFQNFKQVAPEIIDIAEQVKVYSFLFNSGLAEAQQKLIGKPREKKSYWIGQMLPDDEGAAEASVNLLIEAAKKKGSPGSKAQLLALSGIASDATSLTRIAGLNNAIRNRTDVELKQLVATDYSSEIRQKKFTWLSKRYPDISAVWSASYRITDGILDGMAELNLKAGQDIVINSVALNENVLEKVKSGELLVTTDGHYIEGAWVVVMSYDFLSGIDFSDESLQRRTTMGIVTRKNVDLYLGALTDEKLSRQNLKKIDFSRFSKKRNPSVKQYQFYLDTILQQL